MGTLQNAEDMVSRAVQKADDQIKAEAIIVKAKLPLQWDWKAKLITGVIVLVAITILAFIFWPKPKLPITPQQTINEMKVELEKQYAAQIAGKEATIRDYQSRLTVSYDKYTAMANRYIALQKEKENVPTPTTNKEIRDRFTALGYPPIPAK
jgi:hypothetical protein